MFARDTAHKVHSPRRAEQCSGHSSVWEPEAGKAKRDLITNGRKDQLLVALNA